jgi:hypothetical protein
MIRGMQLPRLAQVALLASLITACGGAISVLHTKGKPSGDGAAELTLKNSSGRGIQRVHVAKTEVVDKAHAGGISAGTEADQALWGEDQLGNVGIGDGKTWAALHLPPAHYDVLLIADDRREQLVKHLNLQAGGKYVLEIRDAWRQGRD